MDVIVKAEERNRHVYVTGRSGTTLCTIPLVNVNDRLLKFDQTTVEVKTGYCILIYDAKGRKIGERR